MTIASNLAGFVLCREVDELEGDVVEEVEGELAHLAEAGDELAGLGVEERELEEIPPSASNTASTMPASSSFAGTIA